MRNFYTLFCLLASFFLFDNAYPQTRKAERNVYYDSSAKSYFRYINDPSHIGAWTLEKLLNDRKTRNGASIEYFLLKENEREDTMKLVSFYKKEILAPLFLTTYSAQKGLVRSSGENIGTDNIEPWRDALYSVYMKGLSDSIKLYYLRAKDTIFTEDYYLGYRQSRTIRKKTVFDSLYTTTQTPGAKIFYTNCSSCHKSF